MHIVSPFEIATEQFRRRQEPTVPNTPIELFARFWFTKFQLNIFQLIALHNANVEKLKLTSKAHEPDEISALTRTTSTFTHQNHQTINKQSTFSRSD